MIPRCNYFVKLMAVFCFSMINISAINSAYAYAQQKTGSGKIMGQVSDIINVPKYTYAEIDTGTDKVWAAGPKTVLKIGDKVTFSTTMPMKDFYSTSMERNFSLIYFISRFIKDTDKDISLSQPPAHAQPKQIKKSLQGIDSIEGGQTIAEIHSEKDKLNGKTIRVRGQVTRFAAAIMGKNWLHIQDSSSFDDLTVTTKNTVAVGDVVIIEGTLEIDKDFNYGYVYPVIVQNAQISKE